MSASARRAAEALRTILAELFARERPEPAERWLLAFSGGPDSTALAAALAPLAATRDLELLLVHVDHGADAGSGERARAAAALARRLSLAFRRVELSVPRERERGESPESAARRLRYAALERVREETGATRVLTAHHRDDQVETLLLRISRGAAVEDLGGVAERRGTLLRPLLAVGRAEIDAFLSTTGLEPVLDPTNLDPRLPRNRLRRHLVPALLGAEPGLGDSLVGLATRSAALRDRLELLFAARLAHCRGSEIEMLRGLPPALRLAALRWALRSRLEVQPLPSLPSMDLFLSQLERNPAPAPLSLPRTAGTRRALVARSGRLLVEPVEVEETRAPPFSYTFRIPGEVELPELGCRLRVRRSPVEPWMLLGDPRRAGFSADGEWATVRSRRPGDRLRPLGSPGTRKLKEILVDRRVPASERDRLPILEIGGRIAWVPGVTLDEACRLAAGLSECWRAELVPAGPAGDGEGRKDGT